MFKDKWSFLIDNLKSGSNCRLLYVIDSEGSSPGRRDFFMVVNDKNEWLGSIGGGVMEYDWVNKAQKMLAQSDNTHYFKTVDHQKESLSPSGLICSGKQTIASIYVDANEYENLCHILTQDKYFELTLEGFKIINDRKSNNVLSENSFRYVGKTKTKPMINIIGGGHVGVAFAQLLTFLEYPYQLIDNRPKIVEKLKNINAQFLDYKNLEKILDKENYNYYIVMTYAVKTDIIVLKNILTKVNGFIGVMGSQKKGEAIENALIDAHFTPAEIASIHLPVGININSQTPQEIAISIVGQIIKNEYIISH